MFIRVIALIYKWQEVSNKRAHTHTQTNIHTHTHTNFKNLLFLTSDMQWEKNQDKKNWKWIFKINSEDMTTMTKWEKNMFKMKKGKQNKSYVFRGVEAKWQPVQSLTRLVLLLVRIRTGIPSNWGSTGWRKGRDSGSCRYRASRVGIRAWRSSSGLKTGREVVSKQMI